jgi:carbamoyl-phosphate synthase large subunit
MPKRTDISSILIIGAGPIVIGQACEFDYSGTQAVKTLKEEGYRVILVNSNPATIMTDPEFADATYVEPITPEFVARVIEKERPDALLPTMGGQTALNCAVKLAESGVLKTFGVEMIGARLEAIHMAENRQLFNEAMARIGLSVARNTIAHTLDEAVKALDHTGLPAIIRPSFTLGGEGGGIAYNREEFEEIVRRGLDASPTQEILIDQSLVGWKEFEMEVVRDRKDNCIIICSIENVDPMGVHTGDSITVAPALTLTDKEYQIMRNASLAVLREIGVDTGGSNVQFAINPENGEMVVIEMNPRVSRSSALASKATGFPIAKVAAKLAVGYTLDELENDIVSRNAPHLRGVNPLPPGEGRVRDSTPSADHSLTPALSRRERETTASPDSGILTSFRMPASFEPTLDYIVTKIPRFTFEKFPGTDDTLGSAMKSVGEVMAMGRNFCESLQKALTSMETGLTGLNEIEIPGFDPATGNLDAVRAVLSRPTPKRILYIAQAFRLGMPLAEIQRITHWDPWFLRQIKQIVDAEAEIRRNHKPQELAYLALKKLGFSDARIAELLETSQDAIRAARKAAGVTPVYKRVDTCAAEFASDTSYFYSAYEGDGVTEAECEATPSDRKKVMILGGGPNRIGQGIEFDYCCVHAAYALKAQGLETIMVNCNPETVSTDYDTSDRLYFEPLTLEHVLNIVDTETRNGTLHGVIVQFGGQTPLKLARGLEAAGVPILGTTPDAIDLAEDRERFKALLQELGLKQPENDICHNESEVLEKAEAIGYPVVVRPSYVLGGRAMQVVRDAATLRSYIREIIEMFGDGPILLDSYLRNAIEVDVDAISDSTDVYIAGIMEHIEEAGIHSGDSCCVLPPYSLTPAILDELERQTVILAKALKVRGLMNVQYAIQNGDVYILEVNPRASRTVPFVAKATGVPVAKIAAQVMAGESLVASCQLPVLHRTTDNSQLTTRNYNSFRSLNLQHVAVKEAVFPFKRFPGVDTILGPEMKSTGESMGIDRDFGLAFAKAFIGGGSQTPPTKGTVFLSVRDSDKELAGDIAEQLIEMGLQVIATRGTASYLESRGLEITTVNKVLEGRPHIVDLLKDNKVQLVINTTEGAQSIADSFSIRRTALLNNIPYTTTISGARALVLAIAALQDNDNVDVMPLQWYAPPSLL